MKKIFIFIAATLFILCCDFEKSEGDNPFMEIDTINLNEQLLDLVDKYIIENPQYENYLIATNFSGRDEINDMKDSYDLYIITPANSNIFDGEWWRKLHSPSSYFVYNGRTIYIRTEIDALYKSGFRKKEYIEKVGCDSISYIGWIFSIDGYGGVKLLSKDAEEFIRIPIVIENVKSSNVR